MNHFTTVYASTRSDVYYPVRRLDRIFIVFNNYQSVSQVAKLNQGFNQLSIVTLVQANAWFI